jgi:hypothetical protein
MDPADLLGRRKALRMSQAELGRALGVARNTVARWQSHVETEVTNSYAGLAPSGPVERRSHLPQADHEPRASP